MNALKPSLCIVLSLLCWASESLGQSSGTTKANFYSDTLHWLGLDLSELTFYDYQLMSLRESIKSTYCPHIIGFVRQKYPLEMVRKDFRKKTVIDHPDISFRSFQNLNPDSLVLIDGVKVLPFEKIESLVSNYTLTAESGLGLVAIVTSVSRTKRQSTVVLVFFDVSTRSILTTFKADGLLGNKSEPESYSKSVLNALKDGALKFQQKIPYMSSH